MIPQDAYFSEICQVEPVHLTCQSCGPHVEDASLHLAWGMQLSDPTPLSSQFSVSSSQYHSNKEAKAPAIIIIIKHSQKTNKHLDGQI